MTKTPHDEIHERARKRIKAMTPEERIALLRRAGILDDDGHLAARYRAAVDSGAPEQQPRTADGR